MTTKLSILAGLLGLLAGCASQFPQGQSLTDDQRRFDTLRQIKRFESAAYLRGEPGVNSFGTPNIVAVDVVQRPGPAPNSHWAEVCTVQRMGYTVDYTINFIPRPDIGGTDMKVVPPLPHDKPLGKD